MAVKLCNALLQRHTSAYPIIITATERCLDGTPNLRMYNVPPRRAVHTNGPTTGATAVSGGWT